MTRGVSQGVRLPSHRGYVNTLLTLKRKRLDLQDRLERKRTWRPGEQAEALRELRQEIAALNAAVEALGGRA